MATIAVVVDDMIHEGHGARKLASPAAEDNKFGVDVLAISPVPSKSGRYGSGLTVTVVRWRRGDIDVGRHGIAELPGREAGRSR